MLLLALLVPALALASRGVLLGAPTPLQTALDAAIASGAPSFSLTPNALYTQGASSLVITARSFSLLGNNATLSFAPGYGVLLDACLDVSVSALTVAFSPACFTQGTLAAHNASARTFDVQLDPGFPEPTADYFTTTVETKLQFFDGATRLRLPGQSGSCIVSVLGSPSPGVWRVGASRGFGCTLPSASGGATLAVISPRVHAVGYQIPDGYRGSAWWTFNSTRVTARDIVLLGSGNFAFTEWGGGGGHVYDSVRLARDGANLISSNTDGLHSFGVGAGPTLRNVSLSFMGDDVLNFHNRVGLVLAATPPSTVLVIDVGDMPTPAGDARAPARSFARITPGDTLRLSSPSGQSRGGLAVQAIAWSTDAAVTAAARAAIAARPGVQVNPAGVGVWEMQLEGAGAAGVAVGDVVQYDAAACVGARVLDSYFSDAYDSCFRLQASGAQVSGNTWQRVPGGVSVVYDPAWLEGAADLANVAVVGNAFRGVLWPPATSPQQLFTVDKSVVNFTQSGNAVFPS